MNEGKPSLNQSSRRLEAKNDVIDDEPPAHMRKANYVASCSSNFSPATDLPRPPSYATCVLIIFVIVAGRVDLGKCKTY